MDEAITLKSNFSTLVMEYFDIVDERDRVISKMTRKNCHSNPHFIHRTVHVFVFNSKKQLFVQKRGENKDMYPGFFGSSATGHVEAGDNYSNTAFRETKEELGFEPEMLTPMFKILIRNEEQSEFITVFFCFHKGQITANPAEMVGGEFMDVEEVKNQIDEKKDEFTPFFKETFLKYYHDFWVPNGNGEDEEGSNSGR